MLETPDPRYSPPMQRGVKTSEFWAFLGFMILLVLDAVLGLGIDPVVGSVAVGGYQVSRGLAKLGIPLPTIPPPPPPPESGG